MYTSTLLDQERLHESEQVVNRMITMLESLHGVGDDLLTYSIVLLSTIFVSQKRHGDAEQIILQAMPRLKKTCGQQ